MLATLMARKADVLLLDEPTNDLDIDSREALEDVLREYEGAIVVVSHDRFLLARLCDRVLWIDSARWGIVDGGYDDYEAEQRVRDRAELERSLDDADARPKASRQTPLRVRSQLEGRIGRLERDIQALDERCAEIERLFTLVETYEDRPRVKSLQDELEAARSRSHELVAQWEGLHRELEELAPAGGTMDQS
jgi:ATPase subunit of ABC transporter with duplicated ATPase domains